MRWALLLALGACAARAPTPPRETPAAPAGPRLSHAARSAYLHAHVALARGDLAEAERHLRRALAFDPTSEVLRAELDALRAEADGG